VSPTATETLEPSPYDDYGVTKGVPVPNPNPESIYVKLTGPCDKLSFKVYSKAMVRMATLVDDTRYAKAGWERVPVDRIGLKNVIKAKGTYYLVVQAMRGSRVSDKKVTVKVVVIR
jgi:hypothetical protein